MKITGISTVIATAAVAFACVLPAHAGSWVLTSSVTGTDTPGTWGGQWVNYDTSTSYSFGVVFDQASPGESGSYTYTGIIQWTGGGTQPSTVTLTESGEASASSGYTDVATQSANDGFSDPEVVTYTDDPYPGKTTESSGNHTTTVSIPAGQPYTFTRTLSASSFSTGLNDCYATYSVSIP